MTMMNTKDYKLTETNLARYVPDLWRYGERLCGNEQTTRSLICDTLDTALQKQWKRPVNLPVDTWLNMLMYRQFLGNYNHYSMGKHEGSPNAFFRPTISPGPATMQAVH